MVMTDILELSEQEKLIATEFLEGAISTSLGLTEEDLAAVQGVANMKLENNDPHEALKLYTTLVLCAPQNYEYQCCLSNCAMQMQEYTLALQASSAMISLAPNDPRGYYFSGAACMSIGYLAEAAEDFADAVDLAQIDGNELYLAEALRLQEQLTNMAS